jgi:hypothetical protein
MKNSTLSWRAGDGKIGYDLGEIMLYRIITII